MSTLRRRGNARPAGRRSASSISLGSTSSSSAPPLLGARRRSHSVHDSTVPLSSSSSFGPSQAVSSLFDSLDLPSSLLALREYVAGKLADAERSLQALRAVVEEEASEFEAETETEDGGVTSAVETDDDDEDEDGATDAGDDEPLLRAPQPMRSRSSSPGAPVGDDLRDDISALQAFISSASSFLAAMRDEFPSLSSSSDGSFSSSLVNFQLSAEARTTLDRFLEDHPLPSLPHLGLRSRAASSATAILERVSTELRSVRDALYYLTSTADPASYLPSLPSLPSTSDLSDLRSYFSSESTRLTSAIAQLKDDTTTSLSAGLHTLQDGAAELSAFVKDQSHLVVDEAKRMYHRALEIGRERLLQYEELPPDWRNNEHIHTGYRYIPIEEWGALLKSMWQWHNETVNIHSHLFGALSLVILLVYYLFFSSSSPHALADPHPGDTAIAVLFVISAVHCLLCSWYRGAACVDYVGISGLIAASVAGSTYYGFYEHPHLASSYMLFNLIVGVTGMIVPWAKWFNEREHKGWRIAFFVSLAASAVAPIAHRALIYGAGNTFWFYSPAIPSVCAYLVGLSFYANQFPECCAPGSWNIGASHQLWHVAIVAAVWLHWKAMSDWSTTVALARIVGVDSGVALGAH
ncbi:hypothetical protein Rhopal_005922-T1 [Rhodotorula paludigena]|uniref:HlyIII-domain-containing protein n=1 Tax=Rhodotorula paludigena TaxID=86838 RepID=A0AAV5GTQ0_9BASI|nr:hypothetical protein Rhopal_005922-T1 [Rhodotorula paludigena]